MLNSYQLKRSNRRSISLRVVDGQLLVYAPLLAPRSQIEKVIAQHHGWIEKQLNRKTISINYDLQKDEHLYLLGQQYKLLIKTERKNQILIADGFIYLQGRSYQSIENNWRKYLCSLLDGYVDQIREELNLNFTVSYRRYKGKWGCCYHNENRIVLNYLLACVDEGCIREVIYHEISHFKVHNHQKAFYQQLAEYCPDYRQWVKQLKKYTIG